MAKPLIKSISVENYRGFRDQQTLELAEPGGITFLVGPNNSGKSSLTRLFNVFNNEYIENHGSLWNYSVNDINAKYFFNLNTNREVKIIFNIENAHEELKNFSVFTKKIELVFLIKKHSENIFLHCYIIIDNIETCIMEKYQDNDENERESLTFSKNNIDLISKIKKENSDPRSLDKLVYSDTLKIFKKVKKYFLAFESIKFFDINPNNSFFKTGQELVIFNNNKQNSDIVFKLKKKIRDIFNKLNLEVPSSGPSNNEKKQIEFEFDDLSLNAHEIGTGYSMVYILLMEILRNKDIQLVVIDEIESHLHPGLIRALIGILREIEFEGVRRNLQFILATHSPTVLSCATEKDILYRFQKKEGVCTFKQFFRDQADLRAMREAADELGILPGDALLANVVVWVEGPTDIFWVRALLRAYLPIYLEETHRPFQLVEGLHYAIMMTGGAVISHLRFEEKDMLLEEAVTHDLLQVLRVNPNPFVIIDGDAVEQKNKKYQRAVSIANELRRRASSSAPENSISSKEEAASLHNFWWMKAREIENYCPSALLETFCKKEYGDKADRVKSWDVYDTTKGVGALLEARGLPEVAERSGTFKQKKKLADYMATHLSDQHLRGDTEHLKDLRENLKKLTDYIVQVNDL